MAELLLEYGDTVSLDGKSYMARACGGPMADGMWQGWLEFVPVDGGPPVRSARETTQPNRQDTVYWATGLTPVYLEGSLRRAIHRPVRSEVRAPAPPHFDRPAASFADSGGSGESVLDPFSVYRKGEALLRRQLSALAGWHLINIVRRYGLSDSDANSLSAREPAELVELIVDRVRAQSPGV